MPQAQAAPLMDEAVPAASRNACLRAVASTTNNPAVSIGQMIFSQANSEVIVLVGPQRARWQCLVSNTGIVQNVMSLTNEGAL